MHKVFFLAWTAAVFMSGCANHAADKGGGVAKPHMGADSIKKAVVTPDTQLNGKVVSANPGLRFVVLNFPVGQMPPLQQTLWVYRGGLKMGEIKITGPQRDDNVVGDLVAGEAVIGDEVRDR
jgi:hypothetical protein